jgi:hypothetical protein
MFGLLFQIEAVGTPSSQATASDGTAMGSSSCTLNWVPSLETFCAPATVLLVKKKD